MFDEALATVASDGSLERLGCFGSGSREPMSDKISVLSFSRGAKMASLAGFDGTRFSNVVNPTCRCTAAVRSR